MGCFVRGVKKWHGMFCPGMFCPAPGLSTLRSVAIPLVITGQAVANCFNTGVCRTPGDLRHPKCQGGKSHGQHDWVHGFPYPVKSFLTFIILSQIS